MLDMTEWIIFAFIFVGAGSGFFLLYMRLVRIEGKLREDLAKAQSQQSLQELKESLERLDLRPLEGYLFEIKNVLGRVEKRLSQARVSTDLAPGPPAHESVPENSPSSGDLAGVVEQRLFRMGFRDVKIISDLRTINTDPCEVQVVAVKEEVTYKGRLLIHGGVVVESRMQPSYEVFP